MEEKIVFISDECLFYHLLSEDPLVYGNVETIFNYLSYRPTNKKIVVPPTVYKRLSDIFAKDRISLLYFKNYFEQAAYVNNYNDSKRELILLAQVLKVLHDKVALISESFHGDKDALNKLKDSGVLVMTVHEAASSMMGDKDFREYIHVLGLNKK